MLTHTTTDDRDPYCDDTAREAALREQLQSKRWARAPRGHAAVLVGAVMHTRMRIENASGRPPMMLGQRAAFPVDGESLVGGGL